MQTVSTYACSGSRAQRPREAESPSRGRYLVFIDDDCTPAASWLGELVRELSCDDRRSVERGERTTGQSLFGGERAHPSVTANARAARGGEARGGILRSRRAHGLSLAHVPSAIVYHAHHLTFTQFLRQHFHYGRGIATFRLTRRRRSGGAFLPEPIKFYLNLLLSPMVRTSSVARWRMMALLAAAQCATLSVRCAKPSPSKWRAPPIHLAPGPRLTPPLGLRPRSR